MSRQEKSTIAASVGTYFLFRTALLQRKVFRTSVHFAMSLCTAMSRQEKSTIEASVGTYFLFRTVLSHRNVLRTSVHFAMSLCTAMSRQGKSTIDLCATISFMSRTVQSASRHGVMPTVARSALRLFGRRRYVGEFRASMTCHQANHVTTNSGTFPRKTRGQRKERNRKALHCPRQGYMLGAGGCSEAEDFAS